MDAPRTVVVDEYADEVQRQFGLFLETYTLPGADEPLHLALGREMEQSSHVCMPVDYQHLVDFDRDLAEAVRLHFLRFEGQLREALTLFMYRHFDSYMRDDPAHSKAVFVAIGNIGVVSKLRDLRTDSIGCLVEVSGTVTRTSEVRPELLFASFRCVECQQTVHRVEQQYKYTEPSICPNDACVNRNKWQLLRDTSVFGDWQRVRVQENPSEVPSGSMPRTMDVIVRHDLVEQGKAGDRVVFSGTLVVVPDVAKLKLPGQRLQMSRDASTRGEGGLGDGVGGLKQLGVRDMSYKLAFLCTSMRPDRELGLDDMSNMRPEDIEKQLSATERHEIEEMSRLPQLYQLMTNSVAPHVFGHDDIKRGLLLMLLGGVHKSSSEGIQLRGDINVCIIGDPSTAKSQFLKWVKGSFPRTVYTSGKSSSAAGLTASVVRDEDTGEYTIEAGALMLADKGVCCIDEFDKMDVKDQVAIHEAMEQQTISIAKAGVQATLNARASILAAANPIGGRYDKSRTLRANVAMTPAIMSRFDLFFVVVDECNEASDYNIARHIATLHQNSHGANGQIVADVEGGERRFPIAQLRRYVQFARTIKPKISTEAGDLLVKYYRELRENDSTLGGAQTAYRITVRQLESLIRLSEALARLHLQEVVLPIHVKEAQRLLDKSIIHVETEDVVMGEVEDAPPVAPPQERAGAPVAGDGAEAAAAAAGAGAAAGAAPAAAAAAGADAGAGASSAVAAPGAAAAEAGTSGAGAGERQQPVHKITYEQFKRMTALLSDRLQQEGPTGMKRSQLVEWYLGELQLDSEERMAAEAVTLRLVINRLIRREGMFIEVRDESAEEADSTLILNMNFVDE